VEPTGVAIVDELLGGIVPGLPLVIAGPSGSGRTVLALQLAAGALERGKVVTYLCNEPSPFLLQQSATLGLDLEPAVRSGQLVLLELDPVVGALVRAHGVRKLVEAARAEEPLSSFLVVDPFTILTSEIVDEPHLRATARDFVRAASPMGIALTLEAEQLTLQKGIDRVLSEVCGAFLSLHREPSGRRRLRIEKTRGGPVEHEIVDLRIGEGGARRIAGPAADPDPGAAPAILEAAEEAPRLLPSPEKERPTVLVVDAEQPVRDQLCKWLERDYEVLSARDGFEALTVAMTKRPDLVVLDLVMPRVTGYELIPAFQRAAPEVPLLVISARLVRPADRLAPLVLGATDLLAKPLDRFEFLHKVDILLRLEGPVRRHFDPEAAEELFANVSHTRLLSQPAFRARLQRACEFGERCGLPSSLVAVSAPSSDALDRFLGTADQKLRLEDAVLRVTKRRAVVLLVAVEAADALPVIERLEEVLSEESGSRFRLRRRVCAAEPAEPGFAWSRLFSDAGEEEG
jgi:CheY-like chemotaxis protein/KaiC/GvpD/RAD55 family RecA-like ATPase